ncbi:Centromere/kinetochore Zw10-domain-containing protein [Obelidium mucronatum]|nr:Centromere/kinetochore Zw10-domain-containing protein [Obelidium mucronatum]
MLTPSVTVADLQEAMARLEGVVMSSICSIYLDYGSFTGSSVDFREDVLQVQDMLAAVKKASSRGLEPFLPEQRQFFDSKIELLSLLEKIHRELTGFEMMMETKELSGAATAISDAKALMEELGEFQSSQGCPPEIYKALKSTVLVKKGHLKYKFDELFRTAFYFSRENDISELTISFKIIMTSSSKYHESPVFLMALIKSMNSAGLLSEYLTSFIESFVKLFVTKIIESPSKEFSMTKSKLSAIMKFGDTKTLSGVGAPPLKDFNAMYQKIFDAIKFLRDCLLGPVKDGQWTPENECFVNILSPMLVNTLLEFSMYPSIPDNRDDMSKYGDYLEAVRLFDRRMKDESLFFSDNMEMMEFVVTANVQYARKRKSKLLINVRKIIESEDQNTYEVEDATERGSIRSLYSAKSGGGKVPMESTATGKTALLDKQGLEVNDASFRLPRCQVSVQAQTLVEQAYQTLEEATGMDPESKFATFLDMIPFFRNLGERYFRSQLRKQRDIIKGFLAKAEGFSNLTDDAKFENVERCIKQALSALNALSRVWKVKTSPGRDLL